MEADPDAAAAKVFAKQAWRVEEFAGSFPAIAELRNTLQSYGGAQYLALCHLAKRDTRKICQRTPKAALIDAWVRLFAAAPPGKLPAPGSLDLTAGAPNRGEDGDGGVRSPETRNPKPETRNPSSAQTTALVDATPVSVVSTSSSLSHSCLVMRGAKFMSLKSAHHP